MHNISASAADEFCTAHSHVCSLIARINYWTGTAASPAIFSIRPCGRNLFLRNARFFVHWFILRIFHCACAKGWYFDFRCKIWRHHRVPRSRFPKRCENFGDSLTFKAYIGLLNIWMGFRTSWPKMVFGGQNRGRVVLYWPPTNSCLFFRVLTSVSILVKIDQEMRPLECSQTDKYTDTLTDANRFYNLFHAICYSYGTDH